jgi:pimeloyl-ACP methyl ester carboxylesterase
MNTHDHTTRIHLRLLPLLLILGAGLACNVPSLAGSGVTPGATSTSPPPTQTHTPAPPTDTPPPPTTVYTPHFESTPCQFPVPEGYAPECGYLLVPEDRTDPGSRLIHLHVAIFRGKTPPAAPDPVIHLTGGPGSYGLALVGYYLSTGHDAFLEKRDYIVFDQRGVGYSRPALDCPEVAQLARQQLAQPASADMAYTQEIEAYTQCRERLIAEGVRLSAYNSAASAADVNDLRIALGYDRVNLYGVSYGTRLALTVMRDYPQGIRSVILDSVYPPQVNLYTAWAPNAERAFNVLFDACAADAGCNAAYPDLRSVFYALVDRLNDDPIAVAVPTGTATTPVTVTGSLLMDVVFTGLYRADVIPDLPRLIYQVSDGSTDLLAPRLSVYLTQRASTGMRNAVQCREEVPFSRFEDVLAAASTVEPHVAATFALRLEAFYAVCDVWDAGKADPVENQPVISDIPAIILSGNFDPITPPEWANITAATLSNSAVYNFPGVGHWVLRSGPCGWEVALSFLDDPSHAPDGACIGRLGGPAFE